MGKELLLVQIKQQMGLLIEQQREQKDGNDERFATQQAQLKEKQRGEYAALVKDQAAQQKAVRKECDAKVADVEKYAETIKTKIRDLQAKSEQTEAPAPAANKQVKAVRASESIDDSSDDVGDLAKRQLVAQPDDDDDDASSSRPEDLAGIDKAVQRTLRITML